MRETALAIHEFNKDPSPKDLRWFGLLLAGFFCVVGLMIAWRSGARTVPYALGGVGLALGAVYYALPALRKPMYLAWMYLVFPIGFVVSLTLLALVFFVVLTPIALLLRLAGKDPLARRFDRSAGTYWTPRPPAPPAERYFRQY